MVVAKNDKGEYGRLSWTQDLYGRPATWFIPYMGRTRN